MREVLLEIKKNGFDCLTFLPRDENEEEMIIAGSEYKNPGDKLDGSEMGDMWHIFLFKSTEEGFEHEDLFEAILSDPITYAEQLIPQGWYGMFARKTTTSAEWVQKVFDNFKEA